MTRNVDLAKRKRIREATGEKSSSLEYERLPRKEVMVLDGETLQTKLDYRELARCIFLKSLGYNDSYIEPEYLDTRIRLLREALSVGSESEWRFDEETGRDIYLDDAFLSGNSLKPVDLLGIDGFLEAPMSLSVASSKMHVHEEKMQETERSIAELRQAWILLYLEELLTQEAKKLQIEMSWLVDRGLPAEAPKWDPFDNW